MPGLIQLYPDKESLSHAMAMRFVAAADASIAVLDRFTVALSGGHTPATGFAMLAQEPLRSKVDWSRVHVFWGDERNVPPTDPNSNEKMARDSFLDLVPIPKDQIHPIYTGGTASGAAEAYAEVLHNEFGTDGPTFDLVLLGMGPDGHTASLFPGAGNLDARDWVITAETDVWAVHDRITLTPKAISLAGEVVFEIEGADKAEVLKSILEGNGDYPAGYVARHSRNVTWLLDAAAAANLTRKS